MRSIPSDLLAKLHSNIQTKGAGAQPNMSLALARARTTVSDNSYWTVEEIRSKTGLGDIAVAARRFNKQYGGPDRLYEIHVDNGVVMTAIREYPDLTKDGWQHQFELGDGSNVAIAFDGTWERYRNTWNLRTYEKPWIFWVDEFSVLWGQIWDDISTKIELAQNVDNVSAIRGWKNFDVDANDQGIIVAYVKNDCNVFYRSYSKQINDEIIWELEREVTELTMNIRSVNLFLTNDYRLGFVVDDTSNKVYWLVTGRNWSGMAIPAENLRTSITDLKFEVTPINYEDTLNSENISTEITDIFFNIAEPIYPEFVSVSNPDLSENTLVLKFSHPLGNDLNNVSSLFTLKDGNNLNFNIYSSAQGVDSTEIMLTTDPFSGYSGELILDYTNEVLYSENQGSKFCIPIFTHSFIPEIEPPEGFGAENINIGVSDVQFDVTRVYYVDGICDESITTSITDLVFTVTKVGNDPL